MDSDGRPGTERSNGDTASVAIAGQVATLTV
jgi:hypothetical protein